MFRHEGPSRSVRKNAVLAAYLACVAGFVNSGGFVLIGSFTSHVTGSVGRLGNDIAMSDTQAALFALLLIVSFFVGAFNASAVVESEFRTRSHAYGTALLLEGLAITLFVWVSTGQRQLGPRILDLQAAILCFAMGMQNSLVTRLSGAVVRTTHLTGVVTDLGIEAAHWLHWLRGSTRPRPARGRILLLLTITVSFVLGSIAGAASTLHTHGESMIAPALAVLAASLYAFTSRAPAPADGAD